VKPETIRRIDLHLGRSICFALTCFRKIKEVFSTEGNSRREIKNILFIKLIEQGATVLAYNAVHEAAQLVGAENVYFLVFEENREIISILNLLPEENIVSIRSSGAGIFLRDWIRALRRIKKKRIDATVDFEFFTRAPAVFAFLSGAKIRAGLHRFNSEAPYRGDLLTHRVQYNPYLHVSELYTLLVRALTADPSDIPLYKTCAHWTLREAPLYEPSEDERRRVQKKLNEATRYGLTGPVILLNPNASDMLPLRRWHSQRFVELGRRLLDEISDAVIIITGSPGEIEAAEELSSAIGSSRVICMAGKTSLRELIALYSLGDVLVTNDSGPALFSTLTNIDSVVLFGPETPRLFGAMRDRTHIIWAELACSPCVNVFNHRFSPCRNNLCMQAITVDEVFGKVRDCLKMRADSSGTR
jgi:ADP-heptose:LPS heptosyltransferase